MLQTCGEVVSIWLHLTYSKTFANIYRTKAIMNLNSGIGMALRGSLTRLKLTRKNCNNKWKLAYSKSLQNVFNVVTLPNKSRLQKPSRFGRFANLGEGYHMIPGSLIKRTPAKRIYTLSPSEIDPNRNTPLENMLYLALSPVR